MKPLRIVLQKLIVYPFYKDNIGFFFFWLMLLVGLQNPGTRLFTEPFLGSVVQTPVVLTVILILLTLYLIKCNRYIIQALNEPENEFLYVLGLFPAKTVRINWLVVFLSISFPALFYLGLLTWSAINLKIVPVVILVPAFGICAGVFFTWQFTRHYQRKPIEAQYKPLVTFRWLPAAYQYLTVFARYFLHQAKGLLFLTKLFSLGIIWAFIKLYPIAEYGTRPAAIGLLIGLAGHNLVVFRTRQFEENWLGLLRQLPIRHRQRFAMLGTAYSFALLPEAILLFLHHNPHFNLLNSIPFYLFGITFLVLLHCILYKADLPQEYYFRRIFYLFFGILVVILFSVPLLILALCGAGVSYFLLARYYYGFETQLEE